MLSSAVRRVAARSVSSSFRSRVGSPALVCARGFGAEPKKADGPTVVVPIIADSLEWTLSSPPPLHQFDEPPLLVEVDHLKHMNPGAEVEEVLKLQGETVTDVVGAEAWAEEEYSDDKFEAWVKEQDEKFVKDELALDKK